MDVGQRDIWWAEFGTPIGSEPGFSRPVVVVQSDAINRSLHSTYLCVPLTGSLGRKPLPWNLELTALSTGLPKDSVAQTTLLQAISRSRLIERIGRISQRQLDRLFDCLDLALGRPWR